MDAQKQIEKVGTDILKFLSILGGVAGGQAIIALVPKTNNKWGDILLPGLINIGIAGVGAGLIKNDHAKLAFMGAGVSGTASIIANATAGKGGVAAKINKAATFQNPLAGLRGLSANRPAITRPENLLSGAHTGAMGNATQLFLS